MKVLVTGGAGFIGSHIVDELIRRGDRVVVIDDLSTGKRENLNPKAKFIKLDISNPKTIQIVAKEKPEVIFHLAAQVSVPVSVRDPIQDASTNVIGLLNILSGALKARTKKVVYTSSAAVYGNIKKFPLTESLEPKPISPYGITKLSGEMHLNFFREIYGLDSTVLRYGNVYGPRQNPHGESGVIAIFTKKMVSGERPIINGDGRHTRDYVYVKDVVAANLLAARSTLPGPFNISSGQETSNKRLFLILKETLSSPLDPIYGPARAGDPFRSLLNPGLARRKLGWKTKYTLKNGLSETINWFKNSI